MFNRLLTLATHKIHNLPVIVLMPHSSCNCRCVMCDIWKANQNKTELSIDVLEKHLAPFKKLQVREIVLSGGEALMYSNLWRLCELIRAAGIKVTLLTTGLLIKKYANEIHEHIDNVIISVDGSEHVHNRIRNIPNGFQKIAEGISSLRQLSPRFRITGRCVLQRYNYADYLNTVTSAHEIGLDQISFLPADISSNAFNRTVAWGDERVSEVALSRDETMEFEGIIEKSFEIFKGDYESRFIAESPARMRRVVQYYKAVNGMGEFPPIVCNAPWVSAVVETDGSVMPCFFHKPFGNINDKDFLDIINSKDAISWRRNLNMNTDPICRKCVCTLKLGISQMN